MLKRSIPLRRRCKAAVRTIKGILQRRHVSPVRGAEESRASQAKAKATEGVKTLECSPEELLGVGGTERCESGLCNKGDLMRSGDHNLWKFWYKPVSEIRDGAA